MDTQNLQETPPPKAAKEVSYNLFNSETNQQLNKEPLTEEAARALANQLHESDAGLPLVIRSNRIFLMD
jgi:hypothetical protein